MALNKPLSLINFIHMRVLIRLIGTIFIVQSAHATTLSVNPNGVYKTLSSVQGLVDDGDTILIEAATYINHPQVYLGQNNLVIKGVNGRPRLEAGANLAAKSNGKAILVLGGSNCLVENIEFANARVPDRNGAGIRQEGCPLSIRYCTFIGNEMGILGGNYSQCNVTIEHSVFTGNGSPSNPGFQHNVYINHIDTLFFQYNFTADAIAEGHELKSRAHVNIIRYNYLASLNSVDSRNIDLPNGGTAIILGNIIEQGENSANSNLLGYGLEGLSNNKPHNIWVVNNTFVNKKIKGSFIQVHTDTDTLLVKNNVLIGAKTGGLLLGSPIWLDSSNNFISDDPSNAYLKDVLNFDYRPTNTSPCIDNGVEVNNKPLGFSLIPTQQYVDTAKFDSRVVSGVMDVGAYELLKSAAIEYSMIKRRTIYPNPCSGQLLYVDSTEPLAYVIFDLFGRSIQEGTSWNKHIDISELPVGSYVVKLSNSQEILIRL